MSRLLSGLVALLSLAGSAAEAQLLTTHAGGVGGGHGPLTITGIALSNNSFPAGAPAGTVVGSIGVQTTGGSFGGSASLSGADAARFQIAGSNLATAGVLGAGSYNVGVTATQAGALGSPFGPVAFGITGATGSTWNPADKSPDITLSNGNLTAAASTSLSWRSVRSTTSHSSGKYYFEVNTTQGAGSLSGYIIGLGTSSATLNSYSGSDANGYGLQCTVNITSALNWYNSSAFGGGSWDYCVTGDVLGFAVDLGTKLVWINNWTKHTGWNKGNGDPVAGTGGIAAPALTGAIFIMFSGQFASGQPVAGTVHTGSFTFTSPTGFSPW